MFSASWATECEHETQMGQRSGLPWDFKHQSERVDGALALHWSRRMGPGVLGSWRESLGEKPGLREWAVHGKSSWNRVGRGAQQSLTLWMYLSLRPGRTVPTCSPCAKSRGVFVPCHKNPLFKDIKGAAKPPVSPYLLHTWPPWAHCPVKTRPGRGWSPLPPPP